MLEQNFLKLPEYNTNEKKYEIRVVVGSNFKAQDYNSYAKINK